MRYREPPLGKGGLAVFVSQSGETADTLAVLRYCKSQGQRIASIVNVRTSTIARRSDAVCRRSPALKLASLPPRLSPGSCLCWPASPSPSGGPAANQRRAGEGELVQALVEVPRHVATMLHDELATCDWRTSLSRRRTCSISAAASATRSHSRARSSSRKSPTFTPRAMRRASSSTADRAHRRERARHRRGAGRRTVRQDGFQHAGGGGARRQDHHDLGRPLRTRPAASWRRTCRCRRGRLHQSAVYAAPVQLSPITPRSSWARTWISREISRSLSLWSSPLHVRT